MYRIFKPFVIGLVGAFLWAGLGTDLRAQLRQPFPRVPVTPPTATPPLPSSQEHMIIQLQLQRQALMMQRLRFMVAHQHRMLHSIYQSPYANSRAYNPYAAAMLYGGYGYGGMSYAPANYSYPVASAYSTARYRESEERSYSYGKSYVEQQKNIEAIQLERALGNPPQSEITSGVALNVLLADLRKQIRSLPAEELPTHYLQIDEDSLAQVNVTRGAGGIGLLKQDIGLAWPSGLSVGDLDDRRIQLIMRLKTALQQAEQDGTVDPATVKLLLADADFLRGEVKRLALTMSFEQHVEAKNFINQLDEALVALQQPDLKQYFVGKYTLKARTAFELVKMMNDNGLQFAPANAGDEGAYKTLHQSLAAYNRAIRALKNQSAEASNGTKPY